MKILKNKEYEELLSFKRRYERLKPMHNSAYHELEALKWEFEDFKKAASLNFRVQRIVVGGKGSGKTTFVKNKILPQLTNYFLIDTYGEYDNVPAERKYSLDNSDSIHGNADKIIEIIEANRDKIIIIEEPYLWDNFKWLLNFATGRLEFILITQTTKRIESLLNVTDVIYDLRGSDWEDDVYKQNKSKIISIFKNNINL